MTVLRSVCQRISVWYFMIELYSWTLCMACSLRWALRSLLLVSLHFAFKITLSASVLAFFSSQKAAWFSFTDLEISGDQLCFSLFCLILFDGTLTSAAFLIAFVTCVTIGYQSYRLGQALILLSSSWRHLLYLAMSILSINHSIVSQVWLIGSLLRQRIYCLLQQL